MTDGAVGTETALFKAIEQRLGDARLFTIGIGSAPNSYFMRKAAQFGRGTYTHIGDIARRQRQDDGLVRKARARRLERRVVDWPEAVELYPHAIPDVYAGEPLVLDGELSGSAGPAAADDGLRSGRGRAVAPDASAAVPSELPGIAALWARRKIEHLIDSRVTGVDEALDPQARHRDGARASPREPVHEPRRRRQNAGAARPPRRSSGATSTTPCRPARNGRLRSPRRPRRVHRCAGSAPSLLAAALRARRLTRRTRTRVTCRWRTAS